MSRPLLATLAAAAAGLALLPATAGATSVALFQRAADPVLHTPAATEVSVDALPGESNHITLTTVAGDVVVEDPTTPLTAGAGCVASAPGRVTCHGTTRAISRISVAADDGDDRVDGSALAMELSANGGAGDDTLTGGSADDTLIGDGGDDTLVGGPGNDFLSGWTGADVADGGPGDDDFELDGDPASQRGDVVRCGAGQDVAETPAAYEQLTSACERVTVSVRGTTLEPVTLRGPVRATRDGLAARLSCNRGEDRDGGRCRIRLAVFVAGARTLRATAVLAGGRSTTVRLRGAAPAPGRRFRVAIAGSQLIDGQSQPFRGGFYDTATG